MKVGVYLPLPAAGRACAVSSDCGAIVRKLCESPSIVHLQLIANYLENEGVEVEILNEHQGGNPGVPHWALSVWAELWVKSDRQYDRAVAIFERYRQEQHRDSGAEWRCQHCDETNPDSFETCWRCGTAAELN